MRQLQSGSRVPGAVGVNFLSGPNASKKNVHGEEGLEMVVTKDLKVVRRGGVGPEAVEESSHCVQPVSQAFRSFSLQLRVQHGSARAVSVNDLDQYGFRSEYD